ncbi:hypothetical protein LguiA_024826 [Lonicera macranthoides]
MEEAAEWRERERRGFDVGDEEEEKRAHSMSLVNCLNEMVFEALKVVRPMVGANLAPGPDLWTRVLLREARIWLDCWITQFPFVPNRTNR